MEEKYYKYLQKYYTKLKDHLIIKSRVRSGSVLVSLINIKSNTAYEILTDSSIRSTKIPKTVFDRLFLSGLIRKTDTPDLSVITAKGVWEMENREGSLNTDKLIENIDNKFFDLFSKAKPLTEKEKVILLSMISVRSFSEKTALDLHKGERVLNELEKLIVSTYKILSEKNVIKNLKEKDIFGSKGNEHPVSNLIRHTDPLKKKTKGIYKNIWPQKYYLSLSVDKEISLEGLVFLFEIIFNDQITSQSVKDIKKFCLESAYNKSAFLYDFSEHHFTSPEYDDVIPEALERYYAKFTT